MDIRLCHLRFVTSDTNPAQAARQSMQLESGRKAENGNVPEAGDAAGHRREK